MNRTILGLPSSGSANPLVPETAYRGGIELHEINGYGSLRFLDDLLSDFS